MRVCGLRMGMEQAQLHPTKGSSPRCHDASCLPACPSCILYLHRCLLLNSLQGTTRDDMSGLAHFDEFNELIGLEEKIRTEERLSVRDASDKLHVRVRAPV